MSWNASVPGGLTSKAGREFFGGVDVEGDQLGEKVIWSSTPQATQRSSVTRAITAKPMRVAARALEVEEEVAALTFS